MEIKNTVRCLGTNYKKIELSLRPATMARIRLGTFAIVLAAASIGQADAATRVVNYLPTIGHDVGSCSNFFPCQTIEYAHSVASSGDTIQVESVGGVIAGTEREINIVKNIDIVGKDINPDIIANSLPSRRVVISGVNSNRIFTIDPGITVNMRNLYLTRGYTPDNGGAIYNSGILTMTNCRIGQSNAVGNGGGIFNDGSLNLNDSSAVSDNTAGISGGGIYNIGTLDITDQTWIKLNAAVTSGGGIYNTSRVIISKESEISFNTALFGGGLMTTTGESEVEISESWFKNNGMNSSSTVKSASGGAISVGDEPGDRPVVTITESTISGNLASPTIAGDGGAITNFGVLSLNSVLLENNTSGRSGGAIYNGTGGEYIIKDSTFISNSSGETGGAVHDGSSSIESYDNRINRTSFVSNSTDAFGGAIYYGSQESDLLINNSTFTGNSAEHNVAGAIHNVSSNGSVEVANSTLVANTGGVVVDGLPQGATFFNMGEFNLRNTIVEASSDTEGGYSWACIGGQIYGGAQNFIGSAGNTDSSCGVAPFLIGTVNNLDLIPQDNSGICVGVPFDCGAEIGTMPTHALLSESNAIDNGIDDCPGTDGLPLLTDQNLTPRPIGLACDIGSYEFF